MKHFLNLRSANHMRLAVASVAAVGLLVALPGSAQAAATAVPLANADSFAVLAGQGITNDGGASTITGDIGTHPLDAITGASDIRQPAGAIHAADAVAKAAQVSLVGAYENAAGQVPVTTLDSELGGVGPLTAGVYTSGTFQITGTLTLDAQGDPNAVFIFKAASELNTGVDSNVALINGAQACNVFWQVTSTASLGVNSIFKGTIMALTSITLGTGAAVEGRVLARNGSVSLLGNTITRPTCAVTPPTPSPAPTPSPSAPNQVATVPVGSVSTGNGSSTGTSAAPYAVLGALVVAGIGGAAAVAVRRRRLNG